MALPQPRKLGQRAAEVLPLADPPPAEVLGPEVLARATDWRGRWGRLIRTREPAEGRALLRFEPVVVPLVEVVSRTGYGRLVFCCWLRDQGRIGKGDRN